MASKLKTSQPEKPRRRAATTPEARENQLIALAYDVAEKQLRDGTASSQIITQLMKAGTTRERLEQERLTREVDLLQRKAESMDSAKRVEELYEQAIVALRSYQGVEQSIDD